MTSNRHRPILARAFPHLCAFNPWAFSRTDQVRLEQSFTYASASHSSRIPPSKPEALLLCLSIVQLEPSIHLAPSASVAKLALVLRCDPDVFADICGLRQYCAAVVISVLRNQCFLCWMSRYLQGRVSELQRRVREGRWVLSIGWKAELVKYCN